jgi:hypothetical protein
MNLKMNSRILDLAEHAGSTHKLNLGVYQFYESELKQFAEQIVKECAEVAGCNGHVSGFTLGDLIKEHFGVE